jgi:hypothetical protein
VVPHDGATHTHAIRTEQAHVSANKAFMLHRWPQLLLLTILTLDFILTILIEFSILLIFFISVTIYYSQSISSSTLTCSSPESTAAAAQHDGTPEALLALPTAPTDVVPAKPLPASNPPSLQAVPALTAEADLLKEDTCWLLLG